MSPASRQRRWCFVAGPRYSPPDLGAIDGVAAVPPALDEFATTYFDTADLRVLRWGGQLGHQPAIGWRLSLGRDGHGALHVEREHVFAGPLSPVASEALDLITPFTRGARVHAVLRTRTERLLTQLADEAGRPLGWMQDDRVTVLEGRRIATRFREIELTVDAAAPVGSSALLATVADATRREGAAASDAIPTAVRALGPVAAAPPDVLVAALTRHASASEAMRRAIAASVARLIQHDPAVRIGTDPEGVHQARVATRRLRSDLRTFRPLLERSWVDHLRSELHDLADMLGTVRDADVLLGRLRDAVGRLPESDRPLAEGLLDALRSSRHAARDHLLAAMRAPRYTNLLDDLVSAATEPASLPEASGGAAELLPPLAAGPWRALRRHVRRLGADPSDTELHQVRILAKRSRYAAEAVAPVGRHAIGEFAAAVAALQEVLGEHHDAVVAEQWLRETGTTRGADPLVLGQLLGLERASAAASRAGWSAAWRATVKAHPRRWA